MVRSFEVGGETRVMLPILTPSPPSGALSSPVARVSGSRFVGKVFLNTRVILNAIAHSAPWNAAAEKYVHCLFKIPSLVRFVLIYPPFSSAQHSAAAERESPTWRRQAGPGQSWQPTCTGSEVRDHAW